MHDTALEIGQQFFTTYMTGLPAASILDVGSLNVNGSLRQCAPAGVRYTGVDLVAGPGVDTVLSDPHKLPFADGAFDAVVSTSCFEHDPMFWLTFIEIVRVTKPSGVIYISAPSNGWYHCYPMDNWRFYPDAGLSLESWAQHQGFEVHLLESFIARRRNDIWNDCVMVFERGPVSLRSGLRMCDAFPGAMNVRRSDRPGQVLNRFDATEDQQYLSQLMQSLGKRETHIAWLQQELNKAKGAVQAI
jgi:SAM-dependent methyltransferase